MVTEIATTAFAFIALAIYLSARHYFPDPHPPNPHSVAAIRARLEGEKRVAAASRLAAARLSAHPPHSAVRVSR
ncbi:hypothetical protein ACFXO9_02395 [Nocardia tengchongensis]|uniref:hypothetical protein n=1 Tax=Nocardia tengchongensis TaxID=2055889 RepID=UPI0036CC2049